VKRPDKSQLAIAVAFLAHDAGRVAYDALESDAPRDVADEWGDLAGDLVAIQHHLCDELAAFHAEHDRARPTLPAWTVKGGVA
jgi:hypothetical protein